MSQPIPPAGPVTESARIPGLDVARGFALLGIFFVNIQMFGDTLASYVGEDQTGGDTGANLVAYYAVKTFCDGKFYPLFSLLFGMGLALQRRRMRASGRRFAPLYLRRLALLALIGACHAIFLWYGDILFVYAGAGLILLAMSGLKARTQAIIAGVVIAIATLLMGAFASLVQATRPDAPVAVATQVDVTQPDAQPPAPEPATAGASASAEPAPRITAMDVIKDAGDEAFDPSSPARARAETIAFHDGPYWHAVAIRAMNWGTFFLIVLFGFGWHVVAMFLLGSALMQWGVFEPGRERTLALMARIGLLVGLPLAGALAIAPAALGAWGEILQTVLGLTVGPMVSIGYLGAAGLLAHRAPRHPLTRALAGAGRMALSVYLLESLTASFVFQHWGLAQFGEFSRLGRLALALGLYAALVAFANAWLRAFGIGPMEWLWRTATYLRPPRLRRAPPPA